MAITKQSSYERYANQTLGIGRSLITPAAYASTSALGAGVGLIGSTLFGSDKGMNQLGTMVGAAAGAAQAASLAATASSQAALAASTASASASLAAAEAGASAGANAAAGAWLGPIAFVVVFLTSMFEQGGLFWDDSAENELSDYRRGQNAANTEARYAASGAYRYGYNNPTGDIPGGGERWTAQFLGTYDGGRMQLQPSGPGVIDYPAEDEYGAPIAGGGAWYLYDKPQEGMGTATIFSPYTIQWGPYSSSPAGTSPRVTNTGTITYEDWKAEQDAAATAATQSAPKYKTVSSVQAMSTFLRNKRQNKVAYSTGTRAGISGASTEEAATLITSQTEPVVSSQAIDQPSSTSVTSDVASLWEGITV